MSQIEGQYDEFVSLIGQTLSRVELHMEYKSKVDPMRKQEEIRAKYGFPTQTSPHGLTAVGQMNVDLIEEISKDPEIEYISGTATPASY